jgi:hypothetical protein
MNIAFWIFVCSLLQILVFGVVEIAEVVLDLSSDCLVNVVLLRLQEFLVAVALLLFRIALLSLIKI